MLRQYLALNNTDAARVAARHAQDWASVAADADPVWAAAAGLLAKPLPSTANIDKAVEGPFGPLARSRALLNESLEARATMEKLLSQVTKPDLP